MRPDPEAVVTRAVEAAAQSMDPACPLDKQHPQDRANAVDTAREILTAGWPILLAAVADDIHRINVDNFDARFEQGMYTAIELATAVLHRWETAL